MLGRNPKKWETLRSGKELDEPKPSGEADDNKVGVELNNKGREQKYDEVVPRSMTFPDNPLVYTPPLPFPQRFPKTKLDEQFAQFLNMFKKLEINIPFADALDQIP